MPAKLIRSRAHNVAIVFTFSAFAYVVTGNAAAANVPLPDGCEMAGKSKPAATPSAAVEPVFPPVQIQVRTPIHPTVLPSAGRNYLIYELHLQNFTTEPMTLRGIEILDADQPTASPVADLKEAQLSASLRQVTIGDDAGNIRRLGVGQSAVAFMCLAFEDKVPVPSRLRHRVLFDKTVADGPVIETHTTPLQVLGRPLVGTNWTPGNSPSLHSHHRMGLWVVDGDARISRRYAIDWKKYDINGKTYAGDARDVHAYYAYGQKVLAVADGKVISARDGFPDNVPKTEAAFELARPVTLETIGGNQIVIDVGNGQFAAYYHLQPGSVRVKTGDHVRRGQLLARIGNSGDARWPHLHFQVTDKADVLASEGLPQLFDSYRMKAANQAWETRTGEYPMGDVVIDFGPDIRDK
ncbi:M23 family metallopeptidase [Massilia genomosp. 1]|uniref:Peptidoglycan DD-metalloendopeptidase family protein n=1 Tax=Massilia genomosp. 1 TaxID=2609280 RepID=A0ABX0MQ68_9BURK|nr:M23 family metallopeptidase [Massilia genomosp. 1]NHZ64907.1 peptidoglycan DD-metalloendopeptidase family protein [Massilia genomosp. 1]